MSFLSKVTGFDAVKNLWDDYTGKDNIDKQNQYNMQMWKMQQEYNTPANQMARYREAGLNPNLVYGGSGQMAGNATSAPEMTAHQGSAAKAIGLLETVIGLKGQLEGQQLEKAKVASDIAHSQDALKLEKQRMLLDEVFRRDNFDWKKGQSKLDYDLRYAIHEFNKQRFTYEKDNIDKWGAKPGTYVDFLSKLIGHALQKTPFEVADDTNSMLNGLIGGILGANRPVKPYKPKDTRSWIQKGVDKARKNPVDSIGLFRLFEDF